MPCFACLTLAWAWLLQWGSVFAFKAFNCSSQRHVQCIGTITNSATGSTGSGGSGGSGTKTQAEINLKCKCRCSALNPAKGRVVVSLVPALHNPIHPRAARCKLGCNGPTTRSSLNPTPDLSQNTPLSLSLRVCVCIFAWQSARTLALSSAKSVPPTSARPLSPRRAGTRSRKPL